MAGAAATVLLACSRSVRRVPDSLSVVGKPAMLAHSACMDMLRHHARATNDVGVGGPCRGALAAIEERHGVGAAPSVAKAGAGHLMISCARPHVHIPMCHGSGRAGGSVAAVRAPRECRAR